MGNNGQVGIYIGVHTVEPFQRTLHLIPKILHLGIGCRRGTPAQAIAQAVEAICTEYALDPRAIADVASIDLKQDEAGLLEFCRDKGLPVRFYSAQVLQAVPGEFTGSDFVRRVTGVDNVCERAALMSGGELIVKKHGCNGVTIALATEKMEVAF